MEYHVYWLQKGSCFELFWGGKYSLFLSQKLMERLHLLITENFLYWTFRRGEIRSFFEPKTWWKYIYWLLKSSCFEFFGNGKYGFFWAKKLIERLYLLGLFEDSMMFRDLGNIVFCVVMSKIFSLFLCTKTGREIRGNEQMLFVIFYILFF